MTVDRSEPLEQTISKLVPGTIEPVGAEIIPGVPPVVLYVRKIIELAVTAVVETVVVPPPKVAVPTEAFAPVAIVSLLPAVPRTTFPLVAVMSPVVAVTPVPAVTVVVAAKEVVVVRDPGAVIAEGRDTVTVDPEAAVVIWLAVPAILIFPATGVAVPVSPVREETSTAPPPVPDQFAVVTFADVEKDVSV